MSRSRRCLLLLLTLLLLSPLSGTQQPTAAHAEDGTCIHVDVSITASGELLTKGPQIANDGGFGHAGTGQAFTFKARTFAPAASICVIKLTDARTWQVSVWPCTNHAKPRPARTQSLTWTVALPLDCKMPSSPGLLSATLTNGKGSTGGYVNIYAGAPGFTLPDKQARGLFGPFAMQSDPVNSLTGALAAVETDATLPGPGVPLTAARTYNSNDSATGPLGPGWKPSFSDRLALTGNSATYLASDGREIGFSRRRGAFVVEPGAARFTLAQAGAGYVLTSYDQMSMRFSATGDLLSVLDRNGQGVTVERSDGRVASVANGRRALKYAYDDRGLLTAIALIAPGAESRSVSYGYTDGRLTSVTSPGGSKLTFGYDGAGRLATQTSGSATKPTLTTEYDADGRVISQTDAKGGKTTWLWEPAGIRGTSTMTDPAGGKWINEYELNWLVRQVDPTGATVTFHYDSAGNLIRVFDGLGHGARHSYDGLGRRTASTDAAGNVTRYSYNASNDLVATTDPIGRQTTFGYDPRGNLLTTAVAGQTSSASYDKRGLVTSVRDPLGRVTRFTFSADGDLLRVADPAGRVESYEVDGWGRPTKTTSSRGQSTAHVYSADGQLLEQRGPLGVTSKRTYNDRGLLASATDPRGGVSQFRYDDADQLVGIKGPDSSLPEVVAEYDAAGRVTKHTDASGRTQTFEYDGAGRTTATTYGKGTWQFAYDKSGRLVRTTLPSGKTASFTLDARGAMTKLEYSDKTPPVSFAWDAVGRRTSMTDALGTTRFGYDPFDRLSSVTRPGATIAYQWDPVGNLTSRTAAGHTESYSWDLADRLSSAKVDGKTLASYSYDAARGSATVKRSSGLTETRSYDALERESSLKLTQAAKSLREVTSEYDPAGNLVRSNDSITGSTAYTYDPLNRLTEVCYTADKCSAEATDYIRYAYDGAGNRTWENRPNGSTWSLYGPGSELLASIAAPKDYPRVPPTGRSYSYDPDGNVTSDGTTTYAWNAAGKPTSSTNASGTTTYAHTGDGRRATSTTGSRTTAYLWDPLSPQILQTATGKTTQRYSYGAGLIAQTTSGAAPTGGITSELLSGRTGSLVATSGKSLTHHHYEPYGAPRQAPDDNPKPTAPTYAGALELPNGNYLMGQREYNPATATFLSPDQGGSSQPYAYAAGNPISNNDLQGLDDIEGTLTDVSTMSGWTSTAALAGAVTCTLVRACAPAIPVFLQVSAATGVLSAGTAGVLSAEACVVKGNCSALAADIAVGVVASRFPAIGRARADAVTRAARLGPDSARNNATRRGLSNQLWGSEGRNVFTDAGYLKAEAIEESTRIIAANKLGNTQLREALVGDGSDINDWAKYSTRTYRSSQGPFQVHFYYNPVTGRVHYDTDYKVVLNVAR
ncbi:DUF6531 domain-containing protein [Kribbella sp. CA-293567]|uniref:DUF6531 domain-containing protein n=1 Tax=Kribbella sp. CA-293567 TaxID=3002436 RepID=UPI0022DE93AD|nr:DUF6531 domain-containing protein [Kribbella sp. CA-293567]WBQ07839.1 DUF6531 domain-containing protein [Kribbella sp. CA-293567]